MVHQFALHFITTMIKVIIAVLLLILLHIIIMNVEWMINDALVPTDHT